MTTAEDLVIFLMVKLLEFLLGVEMTLYEGILV